MFVSRYSQHLRRIHGLSTQSLKGQWLVQSGLAACIRPDKGEFRKKNILKFECNLIMPNKYTKTILISLIEDDSSFGINIESSFYSYKI